MQWLVLLWLVAGAYHFQGLCRGFKNNYWTSLESLVLIPYSMPNCCSHGARSELGLSFGAIWIGAIFLLDKHHSLELHGLSGFKAFILGTECVWPYKWKVLWRISSNLGSLLLSNLILQWLSEIRLASNSGFSCPSLYMPPRPANIF